MFWECFCPESSSWPCQSLVVWIALTLLCMARHDYHTWYIQTQQFKNIVSWNWSSSCLRSAILCSKFAYKHIIVTWSIDPNNWKATQCVLLVLIVYRCKSQHLQMSPYWPVNGPTKMEFGFAWLLKPQSVHSHPLRRSTNGCGATN